MKRFVLVALFLTASACASTPEPAPTRTCTVALVRHAEAFTNAGPTDGLTDEQANALTEAGQTQARNLGEELKKLGFERLFTSSSERAVNTANVIKEIGKFDIAHVDSAFTILNRGTDADPEVGSWNWRVRRWKAGEDSTPPGGESLETGALRAVQALNSYCAVNSRFVVVTHSDIIAGIRANVGGTPITQAHETMVIEPGTYTLLNLTIPAS